MIFDVQVLSDYLEHADIVNALSANLPVTPKPSFKITHLEKNVYRIDVLDSLNVNPTRFVENIKAIGLIDLELLEPGALSAASAAGSGGSYDDWEAVSVAYPLDVGSVVNLDSTPIPVARPVNPLASFMTGIGRDPLSSAVAAGESDVAIETFSITWDIPEEFDFLLDEFRAALKPVLSWIASEEKVTEQLDKTGLSITVSATQKRRQELHSILASFVRQNAGSIICVLQPRATDSAVPLQRQAVVRQRPPLSDALLQQHVEPPASQAALSKAKPMSSRRAPFYNRTYFAYVPPKDVFFSLETYDKAELLRRYEATEAMLREKFPKEQGFFVNASIPSERIDTIYGGGFFWIIGAPVGSNVMACGLKFHHLPGTVGEYINLSLEDTCDRFTEEVHQSVYPTVASAFYSGADGKITPEIKREVALFLADFLKKLSFDFCSYPNIPSFRNKDEIKQKIQLVHAALVSDWLLESDISRSSTLDLRVMFALLTDCVPSLIREEASGVWNARSFYEKLSWLRDFVLAKGGLDSRQWDLFSQKADQLYMRAAAEGWDGAPSSGISFTAGAVSRRPRSDTMFEPAPSPVTVSLSSSYVIIGDKVAARFIRKKCQEHSLQLESMEATAVGLAFDVGGSEDSLQSFTDSLCSWAGKNELTLVRDAMRIYPANDETGKLPIIEEEASDDCDSDDERNSFLRV